MDPNNNITEVTQRDAEAPPQDAHNADHTNPQRPRKRVEAGGVQPPSSEVVKEWAVVAVDVVRGFTRGMTDSVDVRMLINYLRRSQALRRLFFQCTVVNMVLFLSVWGASVFVSPLFSAIVGRHGSPGSMPTTVDAATSATLDSASTPAGDDVQNMFGILRSISLLSNFFSSVKSSSWVSPPQRGNPSIGEKIVMGLWNSLFDVLWVIPMFALTQGFGIKWYAELFSEAAKEKKRFAAAAAAAQAGPQRGGGSASETRDHAESKDISEIVTSISEMIFKLIATILFTFVNVLIGVIFPIEIVGFIISTMMNCWLHSFYCFDYRLASQFYISKEVVAVPPERASQYSARNGQTPQYSARRSVKRRLGLTGELSLFETNWAYYLGFGIMATALPMWLRTCAHLPWIAAASLSSVIFGMNVVMTVWATPGPALRAKYRFPVFTPFFAALGWIMQKGVQQFQDSQGTDHTKAE